MQISWPENIDWPQLRIEFDRAWGASLLTYPLGSSVSQEVKFGHRRRSPTYNQNTEGARIATECVQSRTF